MEGAVDLYKHLRDLLDQIPDGMVSTYGDLADALGDRRAALAVAESLRLREFQYAAGKVVGKTAANCIFRRFKTDHPLKRLLELQRLNAERVVQDDGFVAAEKFAGADVAYSDDEAYAACFVFDRELDVLDSASVKVEVRFPYIPGYLSFREAPAIESAIEGISDFDILMVNGHGVAHPRGCGLASQVGLDLDVPTIGVAASRLVGTVGSYKEGWSPLIYNAKVVGAMLVKERHAPLYVSVGHKISLETSVRIVEMMRGRGRLPEPIREAHRAAEEFKRRHAPSTAWP